MSYLYNKYLDWSEYYRNRQPNQYGTTLYPRILDPLPPYPSVVRTSEPLSEKEIDLRRKIYKDNLALLHNPYHRP